MWMHDHRKRNALVSPLYAQESNVLASLTEKEHMLAGRHRGQTIRNTKWTERTQQGTPTELREHNQEQKEDRGATIIKTLWTEGTQ